MNAGVPKRQPTAESAVRAAAVPPGDARFPVPGPRLALVLARLRSEDGQTLTEYSLILVSVALVCLVALGVIGGTVQDFLDDMANQI